MMASAFSGMEKWGKDRFPMGIHASKTAPVKIRDAEESAGGPEAANDKDQPFFLGKQKVHFLHGGAPLKAMSAFVITNLRRIYRTGLRIMKKPPEPGGFLQRKKVT